MRDSFVKYKLFKLQYNDTFCDDTLNAFIMLVRKMLENPMFLVLEPTIKTLFVSLQT